MKEIKKMRKEEFKKLNDGTAFWKTGKAGSGIWEVRASGLGEF